MMSGQMECQPKLHVFFTLHYKFWKYVLLTTISFVSFCFTLAFVGGVALIWKPLLHSGLDLHSGLVDWFLCGVGTGAINGIISECYSSQLSRTSFSIAKKKKKNHSNSFNQTPYPYNHQDLLIKTKVFCWCSLITVLYLFKKTKDCRSSILR